MESLTFVDLFAGMGGFHRGLAALGHECVFASEIDAELRELYAKNFPSMKGFVSSDIRECRDQVPRHDILCAGFPCQSFSKSGSQNGRREKRGTLFNEVLEIVRARQPSYVILENVGNFARHAEGKNWAIVKQGLQDQGYSVRGTEHVASGGHGMVSPHHLGYPHQRERFFAVASRDELPPDPFPPAERTRQTRLQPIVQARGELTPQDRAETTLTKRQTKCIEHWNRFLASIPVTERLPSFPIWGDELWEKYPFEPKTPWSFKIADLRTCLGPRRVPMQSTKEQVLASLPSYARTQEKAFPAWKVDFIRQNREWLGRIKRMLPRGWITQLRGFPASLRKLEWNCGTEDRDLWLYVLQFRPSGLRTKRYTSSPSLVAMTLTQVPILGPERRFITRTEGLRLQGFPDDHLLPTRRSDAFRALGNAVHVGVVKEIAKRLVGTTLGIEYKSETLAAERVEEPLHLGLADTARMGATLGGRGEVR